MLDFVTELCFVTVLMKIYIFLSCLGLTLICKELALSACRLTVVYPVHTHVQHVPALIPVCPTSKEMQPLLISLWVDISAWITDGSWMLVSAGQESENRAEPRAKCLKRLVHFSSVLPHMRQWVILLFGDNIACLVFWSLCVYPRSDCFYFVCSCAKMCQCNKVLYTVEFSTFPVIWLWERLRLLWCIWTLKTFTL